MNFKSNDKRSLDDIAKDFTAFENQKLESFRSKSYEPHYTPPRLEQKFIQDCIDEHNESSIQEPDIMLDINQYARIKIIVQKYHVIKTLVIFLSISEK